MLLCSMDSAYNNCPLYPILYLPLHSSITTHNCNHIIKQFYLFFFRLPLYAINEGTVGMRAQQIMMNEAPPHMPPISIELLSCMELARTLTNNTPLKRKITVIVKGGNSFTQLMEQWSMIILR